jgi:hypothetical protein
MPFFKRPFQGNQGPEGDFMKYFAKELDILAPKGNYKNLHVSERRKGD